MPATNPSSGSLDVLLLRLQECHEVCVYAAIERLVQAGEAVGLDAHALVRMLDRGKTFEELLQVVEAEMERLRSAA